MSKRFFAVAFAIGLGVVAWVGAGFIGASWLALAMTAAIAAAYLLGAWELVQFRAGTQALAAAVAPAAQPVSGFAEWLETVPPALRNAVRGRIEGERGGLPGPALTPYLVGLLVMLGMLGTFLGMVVTFKGAVFALEGSTDLQAIRSALAEPIKGLGLSFGTSVAGVAGSAMLGLMSAIARRERLEVLRQLDQRVATDLLPFSLVHQRQETLRAVQGQARALPEVVDKLTLLLERIERRSQQLDEQLLERQASFQREVTQAYEALARSVGASLQDNLATGARAAGQAIQPVVEAAMHQVVQESRRMQERLGEVAQQQLDALSQQFGATAREVSASWSAALEHQASTSEAVTGELRRSLAAFSDTFEQRSADLLAAVDERAAAQAGRTQADVTRLLERSEELVRARTESEARWLAQHGQRMDQLAELWRTELTALRQDENLRGEAAVARLGELQGAVTQHLATLGAALEAPIARLLHTASEVPQAAAGVIAQLRQEMSRLAERDNLALQERTALLEQLATLLQTVQQASGEHRAAIEALVAAATSVLDQAGSRFAATLAAHAGQAAEVAAHVSGSAVELASLGEAFHAGVQVFQGGNEKLVETLQRIEASLQRSTARSDEQLAYYVAQAREVIDLSIASQQGLVENLRQLQVKPARPVALAGGGRG